MLCGAKATESIIKFLSGKDLFGILTCVNFLSVAVGITAIIIKLFCGKKESDILKISAIFTFSLILSVMLSATDYYCGNGQFAGAFTVFFYNCLYALVLCVIFIGYLFVGETVAKKQTAHIKTDDEIRGEIRKYFENKNPFTMVEKAECSAESADEINFDYIDKLIDKLQKYNLSAEDKKTVEEISFFVASYKGGGNKEKIKFSDYMTTLMILSGKYDVNVAFTQDVLCENDEKDTEGDTDDTVFRYGDNGTCSG